MLPSTLTDRQKEVVEAYFDCNGSELATAKTLGIDVKAIRNNLWLAHRKGVNFSPDTYDENVPAGFEVTNGTLHIVDGAVKQSWPRYKPMIPHETQIFDYLKARVPVNKIKAKKPKGVDPDIQLEWTLADYHFGMLAWGKESGEDYDINIARELLLASATEIFSRAGKVKETVLVLMGDNFHTDFKSNQTEKSHHSLDVDSRYPKIVLMGVETFISAIEVCLQFSEKVKVIVLYGNHDGQTSVNLQYILHFNFRGVTDRVSVDLSPAKERYNIWGSVATMYHHGDGTKPVRLCAQLSDYLLNNDITGIRSKYAKQAHLHKELVEDINNTTFEIVPSPVAKDNFAASANFISKRATIATTYHKEDGELDRFSITPRGLARKQKRLMEVRQ